MKNNIVLISIFLLVTSCAKHFDTPKIIKNISLDENHDVIAIPNGIHDNYNVLVLQSHNNLSDITIVSFDSSGIKCKNKINFSKNLYGYFLYYKNIDSIIYFPLTDETNSLLIYNNRGILCDEINLHPAVAAMNPNTGLKCAENHIYLGNSTEKYGVAYPNERAQYYRDVKPACIVDLKSRNISVFGEFPVYYYKNNYSFYDWFPVICPMKDNCCVLSFACDDSVYVYKNGIKENAFVCKSKFIDKFVPFDDSQAFNMSYCRNYTLSQPKYSNIIHNIHTNEYYRVAEHAKKIGNNGRIIDGQNPSWSILVMDSSFKVTKEYYFKLNEYSPNIIIPSREGVYLQKYPNKKEDSLTLTLFKF